MATKSFPIDTVSTINPVLKPVPHLWRVFTGKQWHEDFSMIEKWGWDWLVLQPLIWNLWKDYYFFIYFSGRLLSKSLRPVGQSFFYKPIRNKESTEFITIRVVYLSNKRTITYNEHTTNKQRTNNNPRPNIQSSETSDGSSPCVSPRAPQGEVGSIDKARTSGLRMLRAALTPIWL
jgi:hypothetical protein